jgi:hypothetical protein
MNNLNLDLTKSMFGMQLENPKKSSCWILCQSLIGPVRRWMLVKASVVSFGCENRAVVGSAIFR